MKRIENEGLCWRNERTKVAGGALAFVVATLILVMFIMYFSVATVKCVTNVEAQELELFYREKEEALVEEARAFLNREGFANSGIMLTRVVEADGSRLYTLTVHHGMIDIMSEAEREDLLEELEKIAFVDENCSFFHEFLVNQ